MGKKSKRPRLNIVTEYPIEQLKKFEDNKRLGVFAKKGRKCVCCHVEGTRLIKHRITYKNGNFNDHIDLYTKKLVLMTVDHMLPKCKKGSENIRNKQPMCCDCNFEKGGKYTPILGRFSWFYRLEYLTKKFLNRNPKIKAKVNKIVNFVKSISKVNSVIENAYSISNMINYSQEPEYVEIKVSKSRSTKRKKKKKKRNGKAIFVD